MLGSGSHVLRRIGVDEVERIVRRCGVRGAGVSGVGGRRVAVGDAAILRASEAAATPRRRRVLQIDYAAEDLPRGLVWLDV